MKIKHPYCYLVLVATLLLIAIHSSSNAQSKKQVPAYTIQQYQQRIANKDTLYIVNFWATWCLPCVKELPYFENIQLQYKNKPVKVLLVSFDFKETYPKKLTDWVSKKNLQCEVVWFSNQNANEFIPLIAPEWEGNLPATFLINNANNSSQFIPTIITQSLLEEWINKQLK